MLQCYKKVAVIFDPASGGFISIAESNIGPIPLKRKPTFVSSSGGGGSSQPQSTLATPTEPAEVRSQAVSSLEIEQRTVVGGYDVKERVKSDLQRKVIAQQQQRQSIAPSVAREQSRPMGTVAPVEKQKGLAGARQKLSQKRSELRVQQMSEPTVKGGAQQFAVSIGTSVIGTAQFGQQLITKPVATITAIPKGIGTLLRGESQTNFKQILREEPSYAVGFIATEVATARGLGAIGGLGKVKGPTFFLGTQETIGSKAITKVAFKSGGRTGLAQSITNIKGNLATTITGGRFGSIVTQFPTGKQKLFGQTTFGGLEVTSKSGKNIFTIGQTATARGRTLSPMAIKFPSGKLFRDTSKIVRTPFASISRQKTAGPLTLVVGSVGTPAGKLRQFVGIIVAQRKEGKFFTTGTQQTITKTKAIQQLSSADIGKTLASATAPRSAGTKVVPLPKVPQTKVPLTQPQQVPRAQIGPPRTMVFPVQTQKAIPKVVPSFKTSQFTGQLPKQVPISKGVSSSASKIRQVPVVAQVPAQIPRQVPASATVQAQPQASKQRQALKFIQPVKAVTFRPMIPQTRGFKPIISRARPRTTSRSGQGLFTVSIRRGGVFKPIGTGLTGQKAVSLGQQRVSTSLGATFKLTPEKGQTTSVRTPKGFKRKKGLTFIEAPQFRLSTGSETREIQTAKRRKR